MLIQGAFCPGSIIAHKCAACVFASTYWTRAGKHRSWRHPDDSANQWLLRLSERRHPNVATVALADHIARRAWALLALDEDYQPTGAPAA